MSLPFYKIRYWKEYSLHSVRWILRDPRRCNSKLYCTTCGNVATQIATFQIENAPQLERYCQSCIDANKHLLTDNEQMANYDDLVIKAEPDSAIYELLHTKNREE